MTKIHAKTSSLAPYARLLAVIKQRIRTGQVTIQFHKEYQQVSLIGQQPVAQLAETTKVAIASGKQGLVLRCFWGCLKSGFLKYPRRRDVSMSQMLRWEEIRQQYPETFVLLDHCIEQRHGKNWVRIMGGEVVFSTSNGKTIYDEYCKRGQPPQMTFGHTHCENLEMEEVPFLGIRPSHD